MLGAFLISSTVILSLPGDFELDILVSAFTISSIEIIKDCGFGSPIRFSVSVTFSL